MIFIMFLVFRKFLNFFQINLSKNVVFFTIIWYDKNNNIKWGKSDYLSCFSVLKKQIKNEEGMKSSWLKQ